MENDWMRAKEISRSLYESAVLGIYLTSAAGRYAMVNPALAHILGYNSPEDLINTITDIDRHFLADPLRQGEFHHHLEETGSAKNSEAEI
ncbi:MAG: PAS domain-containing protein [Methanothrix sp.]|nr:PAS domain-containing protein [Methanothrix sp.]